MSQPGLEFRILGPLEASRDGETLPVAGGNQQVLLGAFLVYAGEVVSTDWLIEALWEDDIPRTARHSLHVYISRLRNALGDGSLIVNEATGYRLSVDHDCIDAHRFERLGARARQTLEEDPEDASRLLEEALTLWRGPALEGFSDRSFARAETARLEELRLSCIEDKIQADLTLARYPNVVADLEVLVKEHPLREKLWALLMIALYRAGRQADALGAFQQARAILGEELGIEPGAELRRLEERILLQDPALDIRYVGAPEHNLPVERTSFVGRERELSEIHSLLTGSRLVTLTGPPGSGKTRLALRLASLSLDEYPDGVFLVPLAEVEDTDQILPTVARALGVAEVDEDPLNARLGERVAGRQMLLVFDNFEHLLEGGVILGNLIDMAASTKFLVTSRARLGVIGEQEYPVPPLDLPDGDVDDVAVSDAAALFVDRARAIDPRFRLDGDTASVVFRIVCKLEGLPLAIELAAARIRLFELETIARRLEAEVETLGSGPADAPARHHTMHQAVAWSYELLRPAEQAKFRRLGVFAGGFTLDAAEAVGHSTDETEMLEIIETLLDHSLLTRPVTPGEARFAMLEVIRAFALDQLRSTQEYEETAHRHASYYLGLAEEAEPVLVGSDRTAHLDLLEREHPNLRAALRFALESDEIETGLRIAGAIWRFWQQRGYLREGKQWLRRLLDHSGPDPTPGRVKGLNALAGVVYWLGEMREASNLYEQTRQMCRTLNDLDGELEAILNLAQIAGYFQDDLERAEHLMHQYQELAGDDDERMLKGLGVRGLLRITAQDLDQARSDFLRAREIAERRGMDWGVGQCQVALGRIALAEGSHDRAKAHLLDALDRFEEAGDLSGIAQALDWLAAVAIQSRQAEQGLHLAGAVQAIRDQMGGGLTFATRKMADPRQSAKRSLDDQTIELAWNRGLRMTVDEALSEARSTPHTSPE